MDIRKIANFSQEDFEALTAAGTILGALNKAISAGEINELEASSMEILQALFNVTHNILENPALKKFPEV